MEKRQNQYRRRTSLHIATYPIRTNCNHRGRNGHVNISPIIGRSFGADFLDGIVDGVHPDSLLDFTAAEVLSSEYFLWFFHGCGERLCCGRKACSRWVSSSTGGTFSLILTMSHSSLTVLCRQVSRPNGSLGWWIATVQLHWTLNHDFFANVPVERNRNTQTRQSLRFFSTACLP